MLEDTRLMTLDEFIQRYSQEGAFEIYNGVIKPLMPNVTIHGWTLRILFRLLDAYCTSRGLGQVFTELPFVMLDAPNWVKGSRVPDLMFISATRWADYTASMPEWKAKPIVLVPDLVVEVVSPTDVYSELHEKVVEYLKDGVRLVWVLDPQNKSVSAYQGERFTALNDDAVLLGSDLIPEFEVKVSTLFES